MPKPFSEALEFSQTTIGSPIPYIAGTARATPVLVWYGREGASLQSSGDYKYRVDMLFAIGVPMWDEVAAPWSSWRSTNPPRARRFWYGDRGLTLLNSATATPSLLHRNKAQVRVTPNGSVVLEAGVHFYDGRADQTLASEAVALSMAADGVDASTIPGYRHRMLLDVLATPGSYAAGQPERGSIGSSPRVPAIAVEVSAVGPQPIGLDANPAWVLYDLLCRPVWGLGIDPDDVDIDSFQAAADTLESEGHGCSVVIEQAEDAARIFAALTSQIDGVIYEAPSTGKIKLKLIRSDYIFGDLPVMNADNVAESERPTVDDIHERDCPNEIRVNFTDRSRGYKRDTLPWKKEGNAAARSNQRRPIEFDAPGCMTAELAAKIAARELAVVGRPIRTIKIKVNREFYALELGDAVRVDLPQYDIDDDVYRVLEIDGGQLADGAITVRLIRDIFDQTVGGFVGDPAQDQVDPTLLPIIERYFDEAPYHLAYLAALAGVVPNLGVQRLLAAAAPETGGDFADLFRVDTTAGGPGGVYGFATLPDIPQQFFPGTAIVATDYPRAAEPYDDVTGIVIENTAGALPPPLLFWYELSATPSEIINQGKNLALLGGATGQAGEVIAFESVTQIGLDSYRLNNVWRGLLDTAPVDHPAGTRLYLLSTNAVGRRDWITDQYARGYTIPSRTGTSGSAGVDATDDLRISIVGRRFLPLRAADVRVTGYDLDGTPGPGAAVQTYPLLGDFKAIRRLEGALDIAARQNRIDAGKVVRGDDATYTAETGTTWDVYVQKVGEDETAVTGQIDLATPEATGVLVAGAGGGHGELDVILHSKRDIGPGLDQRSWQSPRIRCTAPTWRNLLANDSLDYGALTPGWSAVVGTAAVDDGTDSLQRYASAGYWLEGSTSLSDGADAMTIVRQTVSVTGYKPGGLTAIVSWYSRNLGGPEASLLDFSKVTISALDDSDAVLTSTASSNVIGPSTHWRRAEVSHALPNATRKIRVDVKLVKVDGGGSGLPSDTAVTRIRLQVGQMGAELLSNGNFDGALTSWTTSSGGFVVNTTNPYASSNGTIGAAQGGAFATSELKQEALIPAGYEYGTALLTLARSTTIDLDPGEVFLEVLDSGSVVIAAATTGPEYSLTGGVTVLDVWERRRLSLPLPDGAFSIRVRLIATRSAAIGISGACFDDLSLRIHKDLDPVFERDFDFRTPSWQPAPPNWQRFHLAWPTLPVPFMAWDGASATPTVQPTYRLTGPTHAWSDAIAHTAASFVGYWDIGPDADEADPALARVTSTEAYQFTRAIAASAIDLQTIGQADETGEEYGAFALDEDFTIAVLFRTDETTWTTAAGLAGRRGNTGIGWGMRITAGGLLEAVLQGASSTATATAAISVADRAPHWAFLVNEAGTETLVLYDDHGGSASVSTAGVGSIDVTGVPLRIGRDGPASATGGLQIARVYVWRAALRSSDVSAIMQYGTDPSGLMGSFVSDRAVWVPGPEIPADDTLIRFSADDVPIGRAGGSYGLVTASSSTNKIPTHDFTNATYWAAEGGASIAQGIVDATGLPRGVRVINVATDQGLRCTDITMGVGSSVGLVFYARTIDSIVNRLLIVTLLDAGDNLIDIEAVTITSAWQRVQVVFTGWANATPTARLRFVLGAMAVGTFDLCHVTWMGFEDPPFAIQDPTLTISDTYGERLEALPLQLNREGEIYIEGVCPTATPADGMALATVDNDTDSDGERAIATGGAGAVTFTLYNATGTGTDTSSPAIDWSAPWKLRGRWNRLELPESLGDQVGIVVDGSVDSATYDPLAFTVNTSGLVAIHLGGGDPELAVSANAILHRVIVRAREPKLS